MKLYGKLEYLSHKDIWQMSKMPAHVKIKLKKLFTSVPKNRSDTYNFKNTKEICLDLDWFLQRYPMEMSTSDRDRLTEKNNEYKEFLAEMDRIIAPNWNPQPVEFKDGLAPYKYQQKAIDLFHKTKRLLCGDQVGLGKTVVALGGLIETKCLPAAVVVQPHLVNQWYSQFKKFTNLRVHAITAGSPEALPEADVYILKYTNIYKWTDVLTEMNIKTLVLDEVQEVRRQQSQKHWGCKTIADTCEYVLGLSGTPIFNYGFEVWTLYSVMRPDLLSDENSFRREWCGWDDKVSDPVALGSFLRDSYAYIRRTTEDEEVVRERPRVNKFTHTVGFDKKAIDSMESEAKILAHQVLQGEFIKRGQAARELSILIRKKTGISKARDVANYVKMILDNGEKVLLAGWHRDCFIAGTEILMYDGTIKKVQDIVVGDKIMGPDGKARNIRSTFSDIGPTITIMPKKGQEITCSAGHLVTTEYNSGKYKEVRHTKAKDLVNISNRQMRNYTLMRSEAVEFDSSADALKEPWLIGFWIGDGAKNLKDLRISSQDEEVSRHAQQIASKYNLITKEWNSLGMYGNSKCKQICFSSGTYKGPKNRNTLLTYFRDLGLNATYIPYKVKTSSIPDRKQVLAGLLDSDGHIYQNACGADYTTIHKTLAKDVAFICRSLGLAAYIKEKKKSLNSKIVGQKIYYKVSISGELADIPMIIKRKQSTQKRIINKRVTRVGFATKEAGIQKYYGFETNKDHLFLLSDFTIVHNCYDIWLEELKDYNPVLFTGTESPTQKDNNKEKFVNGDAQIMMISLRSAVGLDGLQYACKWVVFGELDWTNAVHDQVIGRLDRNGQEKQVNAAFLVSDSGSDPVVMDILALKRSQQEGINDPTLIGKKTSQNDDSIIKEFAKRYLDSHK